MLPRRTMKKQNFKGKFGNITNSVKKPVSDSEYHEPDTCTLTDEQKTHIKSRYSKVNLHNSNLTTTDNDYITQEDLRDEFNQLFGVNKSVRSYYRIWNEFNETDL